MAGDDDMRGTDAGDATIVSQPPIVSQPSPPPKQKNKAKLVPMPTPRRSARLNPGTEGSLTDAHAQTHTLVPGKTAPVLARPKLFFGKAPPSTKCKGKEKKSPATIAEGAKPSDQQRSLKSSDHQTGTGSSDQHPSPTRAGASGHVVSPTRAEPSDLNLLAGSAEASGADLTPTRADASGHAVSPTRANSSHQHPSSPRANSSGSAASPTRAEAPESGPVLTAPSTVSAEQSVSLPSWEEWDLWEAAGQTAGDDRSWEAVGQTSTAAVGQTTTTASLDQTTQSSTDGEESSQSCVRELLLADDGGRRCRNRRPLRFCPKALSACGQELEQAAAGGAAGKRKRKRNKGKSELRCGRGLGKPRDPVPLENRPELLIVGDGEFTTADNDTKIITTIRLLTLENMPGPFRSYNYFSSKTRLAILQQFLQRYSWGAGEDIGRCLDVFENIAADAYSRELTETRALYKKKYGRDIAVWSVFPPKWCKNHDAWRGLCDIWSSDKWDQLSVTNRSNQKGKVENGKVDTPVRHVSGSRSTYRHKLALSQEKGSPVGLKEVFDRTHMRNTEGGKKYVTERAETVAKVYTDLQQQYCGGKEDEEIWEEAVNGEQRGRLYGFGKRSRTSKSTRILETLEAEPSNPTKSTATSASDAKRKYSKDEVADLIAAERARFAAELDARDKRHKIEIEKVKRRREYHDRCFDTLFDVTGATPPSPPCNDSTTPDNTAI